MTKKCLYGPNGIRVTLDSKEIFPADPGQGTPAMVYLFGYSATYGCAANEGELSGGRSNGYGMRQLTSAQLNWLQSDEVESAVWNFISEHTDAARLASK